MSSMGQVRNFGAGPAALPPGIAEESAQQVRDLGASGVGILEHSHRSQAYASIHRETIELGRALLEIPDEYAVLLVQGGASWQFAMVPLNFLPADRSADYVITGAWAQKAAEEAARVGRVRAVSEGQRQGQGQGCDATPWRRVPTLDELRLDPEAAYLHITTNNTIVGTQWRGPVDRGDDRVPLVADMSSDLLSRRIDVGRFALIYAGLQKNLGTSGAAMVIVRRQWLQHARQDGPKILQYRTHETADLLYHTPPVMAVAVLRNVLRYVERTGGLVRQEQATDRKASLLYSVIDAHPAVYRSDIDPASRPSMNVVFMLSSAAAERRFLEGAERRAMIGLPGHRSIGGVRVSLYNGVREEWVRELAGYMHEFAEARA